MKKILPPIVDCNAINAVCSIESVIAERRMEDNINQRRRFISWLLIHISSFDYQSRYLVRISIFVLPRVNRQTSRHIVTRIPKVYFLQYIYYLSYLLSTWLTIERSMVWFSQRHFGCETYFSAFDFPMRHCFVASRRRTKCSPQGIGCFHRSPRLVRAPSGACFCRLLRMRVGRDVSGHVIRDNVGRFEIICLRKREFKKFY